MEIDKLELRHLINETIKESLIINFEAYEQVMKEELHDMKEIKNEYIADLEETKKEIIADLRRYANIPAELEELMEKIEERDKLIQKKDAIIERKTRQIQRLKNEI